MMKYDIDWYLSFKDKATTSFICNLVNTLGLTNWEEIQLKSYRWI